MDVNFTNQPQLDPALMPDDAIVPAPMSVSVIPENISIYAKCIDPGASPNDSDVCPFDITLVVEVRSTDADGCVTLQQHQIIKRVAFDKFKIYQHALTSVPTTVVEGKKIDDAVVLTEQMRRLAGF